MEIRNVIIMRLAVGYIFMGFVKQYVHPDPLTDSGTTKFDFNAFKLAILVTAPSVVIHEFGHKFVAMAFGLTATFKAAYFWLLLGIFLKAIGSAFIFFVPAYVSFSAAASQFQVMFISIAGPLMNLVMFGGAYYALKYRKVSYKFIPAVHLFKQINLFLFGLNMIPIPGFDGFHFFRALLNVVF